jgi:HEAT repeat protein
MQRGSWFIDLDQLHSSYLLLGTFALVGLLAGFLYQIGFIGWLLGIVGRIVRSGIHNGFLTWRALLSWASWPVFLAAVLGFVLLGLALVHLVPIVTVFCGLAPLFMGVTTCLAYMFIDIERYEVERGYKAVHNPLKGQALARHLAEYGHLVRFPLLLAATVGMITGFALLNQGLYESVGRDWYAVGADNGEPSYFDFLAYGLINLLGVVDVLNLANNTNYLHIAYVHQNAWPATTLLRGFRVFFTFVLLQQIFASVRQGRLLTETIADFWSPHEPIRERAHTALPQYGAVAIGPLLLSLRSVQTLTKEHRDRLPEILATIGPSIIPGLVRNLHDPHEHIRAVVVATLGRLQAVEIAGHLAQLAEDPSDIVRQSLAEAMGFLGGASLRPVQRIRRRRHRLRHLFQELRWSRRRRKPIKPVAVQDPVELAITTLQQCLGDKTIAVRNQAANSLGLIGGRVRTAIPSLIGLLKDDDETVRCQSAEALGKIGNDEVSTVAALTELLQDASAPVKASAARALGSLKKKAASAVPALVPLLQDRDETVRAAAAEAISQVGPLDGEATESLVEGLTSEDHLVQAQAADGLGAIGTTAQDAAPALVDAVANGSDRVRAKAVEALGKIGEAAAEVAVPSLVRALRGDDSWVSALAAEALGQMGESADEAVPALVRSLGHTNALVRSNAAEALTKMGSSAVGARSALEKAAGDEDGGVRSHAIRALGVIGQPTAVTQKVVLDGLQDADPLMRAASVEAIGEWGETSRPLASRLLPLLEDATDQVKVQTAQVLPKLAGPTKEVVDGLCGRLQKDDSAWAREQAAAALGRLGPAAMAAGSALLRAAQTGEVGVRLEAMKAIALIQPPETIAAFASGIRDSDSTIRKVASGGWMKAETIPEEVISSLVEALRDPEVQVRANAAHALARLEELPFEAIPLLVNCTADPSDGLRINAAMALKLVSTGAANEVMHQLLDDPNSRIRLIAASCILPVDSDNAKALAVVADELNDPALRVRKAAEELAEAYLKPKEPVDEIPVAHSSG